MVKLYKVVVRNGIWYRVPRYLIESNLATNVLQETRGPIAGVQKHIPFREPQQGLKIPWYVQH
jgi:hypothetical protein